MKPILILAALSVILLLTAPAPAIQDQPTHNVSLVISDDVYSPGDTALFVVRSSSDGNATLQVIYAGEVVLEQGFDSLNSQGGNIFVWDIQRYAANGTYTVLLFLNEDQSINDTEDVYVYRDFGFSQKIFYQPIPFNITILNSYGRFFEDPVAVNITNLHTGQSEEWDDVETYLEIEANYQDSILALPGQAILIIVESVDRDYFVEEIVSASVVENVLFITVNRVYSLLDQALGWGMGAAAFCLAVYVVRRSIVQSRPHRPKWSGDDRDVFELRRP